MEPESLRVGEESPVEIQAGSATLRGNLTIPEGAAGLVLFAHGSGSSRHSPRNRFVAEELQDMGLATLLLDLLTVEEEAEDAETGRLRFDIGLLARRLIWATDWAYRDYRLAQLPAGYFGASTGAAAALIAAGARPEIVRAVVSRGGRPDLAGEALPRVQAPTLLIVGGADDPVIALNRQAMNYLHVERRIMIVPGATHLFEEPGALDEVARLAGEWFGHYLAGLPLQSMA